MKTDYTETVREWHPHYLNFRADVAEIVEEFAAHGLPDDEMQHAVAWVFQQRKAKAEVANPPMADAGVQQSRESHPIDGARDSIPASAGEGDGVQSFSESQGASGPAPSTQSEEEAIQGPAESHVEYGPSFSPPDRNGGVHLTIESHGKDGASIPTPERSGEVHERRESAKPAGLSAVTPTLHHGRVVHEDLTPPTIIPSESQYSSPRGLANAEQVAPPHVEKPLAKTHWPEPLPAPKEPSKDDLEAMEKAANIAYFEMIKLRSKAWSAYRGADLAKVRSVNNEENLVINEVLNHYRMNRIPMERLVYMAVPEKAMKQFIKNAKMTVERKLLPSNKKRAHG